MEIMSPLRPLRVRPVRLGIRLLSFFLDRKINSSKYLIRRFKNALSLALGSYTTASDDRLLARVGMH